MRTISAIFENEADARAARDRIIGEARVDANRVSVVDRSRPTPHGAPPVPAAKSSGLWAQLKELVALPDGGRPSFEHALERGGWLLTASVPEDRLVLVLGIVERAGIADLGGPSHERDDLPAPAPRATSEELREARIPVVEERLALGKEELSRGGVRVQTHAAERPVHERVFLKDYRVRIERRAAERAVGDLPPAALDDLFRERTVELTETAEEAVIGKQARVREELVVRREVQERVEEVSDVVRRTEVDVQRFDGDRRPVDPRRDSRAPG